MCKTLEDNGLRAALVYLIKCPVSICVLPQVNNRGKVKCTLLWNLCKILSAILGIFALSPIVLALLLCRKFYICESAIVYHGYFFIKNVKIDYLTLFYNVKQVQSVVYSAIKMNRKKCSFEAQGACLASTSQCCIKPVLSFYFLYTL